MLDYILHLNQEGPTLGRLIDAKASLAVLEEAGQVGPEDRISCNKLWLRACDSLEQELHGRAGPVHKAPPLTVAMIISLELEVMDTDKPEYARALCWIILLAVWACMRLSDFDGLDHSRLTLSTLGLRGYLVRTKTTGPGKKVREVPIYVKQTATLAGTSWLCTGFDIWERYKTWYPTNIFLMRPQANWNDPIRKYMGPEHFAGCVRSLFLKLEVPHRVRLSRTWRLRDGEMLLDQDSGHSMRHFLPTVSAGMGVQKEQRDFLGRWVINLHQSSDYVLSSMQNVHKTQELVCQGLCTGEPGGCAPAAGRMD